MIVDVEIINGPDENFATETERRQRGLWRGEKLCGHGRLPKITWGEWAIAMHGRYESPILFISFTYICYVHTMIFLYFSTIYFILDIPYMEINRSITPADQL